MCGSAIDVTKRERKKKEMESKFRVQALSFVNGDVNKDVGSITEVEDAINKIRDTLDLNIRAITVNGARATKLDFLEAFQLSCEYGLEALRFTSLNEEIVDISETLQLAVKEISDKHRKEEQKDTLEAVKKLIEENK